MLTNSIKHIISFLSVQKFTVSVEGEMSTLREMQARVPQGSVLSPTLYSVYINDTPQTLSVCLTLFVDNSCMYATDRKEGYVLSKLQRGLNSTETWCKRWDIEINEDKIRTIYFSHRLRPPGVHLTLNRRNILFVNHTLV
jgi:hypothetical protein